MITRILSLFFILFLVAACDMFPTKESKKREENQEWFDNFYGNEKKEDKSYCSFYGTCEKSEKSGLGW